LVHTERGAICLEAKELDKEKQRIIKIGRDGVGPTNKKAGMYHLHACEKHYKKKELNRTSL